MKMIKKLRDEVLNQKKALVEASKKQTDSEVEIQKLKQRVLELEQENYQLKNELDDLDLDPLELEEEEDLPNKDSLEHPIAYRYIGYTPTT